MKKTGLHNVISVLVVLLLMLPVAMQLMHTLENHEHTVCNSEDTQHIHKQELDCSIYHVKLRTESPDLNCTIQLFIETEKNSTPLFLAKNCTLSSQKIVRTRGSPLFII